ncbi:hypothetical protein GCM10017673_47750 [Streptosporangium violaceochromogenes]|nr:hypothetical protein GCM10017673_47750 [Streptosporangium violaceochromogenes]
METPGVRGRHRGAADQEGAGPAAATVTGPIFLIVDGFSLHTARAVRDFAAHPHGRLRLFSLPAHAPDPNPNEWVNQNIKAQVARQAVTDEHELTAAMHRL